MRKPDNNRKPASGRPFKTKDGLGSFKKSSGNKSGESQSFSAKRERPARDDEKPRRNSEKPTGRKPFGKPGSGNRDERPSRSAAKPGDRKPLRKEFGGDRNRSHDGSDRRTFRKSERDSDFDLKSKRFEGNDKERQDNKSYGKDQFSGERRSSRGNWHSNDEKRRKNTEEQAEEFKPRRKFEGGEEKKPFKRSGDANARKYGPERFTNRSEERRFGKREEPDEDLKRVKFGDFEDGKVFSNKASERTGKPRKPGKKAPPSRKQTGDDGMIRLNKYLSNAGVASRREADTLIQSGVVKVNGVVVDQLGTKINPGDKVTYSDAPVRSERKVYLLLNKPKDYITTTEDPQERKTVMELISKACKERVYPVGRLDRNTTGLLLFTNDGELTTKLTHPKFGVKKVYHVSLNKGLKPDDFKAITEGVELEDGMIKADDLAFVGEGKKEIGIEIHSGRNRIVRRIFEHLGYDVLKLDRVVFAGLTKKDLPRGKHRFLTAKEIGFLQMIG